MEMLIVCLKRHMCFLQQFWEELAGAAGSLHDGLSPESMGSLGGWGGPETLAWVHPLEFATKISQVDHRRIVRVSAICFTCFALNVLFS
jgi:hypothetical protein